MLTYLKTFALRYSDDCALMGMTPEAKLVVEEYYGTELEFAAQTCYDLAGNILLTADEPADTRHWLPLELPANSTRPHHSTKHPLNYGVSRRRGLREPERLNDWVHPVSIMEKMTLIEALHLGVSPMQLGGIAESRVLAIAHLNAQVAIVCRVVRLALLLPQVAVDAAGLPYDYDTLPIYVAQVLRSDEDTPVFTPGFQDFYGVRLHRPQDCLLFEDSLWIADGGDKTTGRHSQVHAWRVQS